MKQFAIFGNPVEHSISPLMHNLAFQAFNLNANYSKHKLEDGKALKDLFNTLGLSGANVTVPHKEVAYELCDEIKGVAKKIQAINTIIKQNDKLIGYNTDAPGFIMAIHDFLPLKSALIIGAGGTAKAIACALMQENLHVSLVNRSEARLQSFKNLDISTFTWDNFKPKAFDLVINTTSAGLNDDLLPLPQDLLTPTLQNTKFAFDVIYHKITPFISLCKKNNLTCKDGKDMLLYQGVLAFNLFFENKFNEKSIITSMKQAFIS